MSTPKSINTNFRTKDDDLYHWIMCQLGDLNNPANRSKLGRDAFECLRLFNNSITEAQLAKCALAYLKERYPMQWQDILDGKEFSE